MNNRCKKCGSVSKPKFKRGDKVEVNGNKQGRVLDYY